MSDSFVIPWTVACQPPLYMDFPGKNTGVGCHSLLQRNLPDPGVKPTSPSLQADCLPSEPPGKLTFVKELAKTLFGMRLCYPYKIFLPVIKVSSPLVLI